MSDTPPASNEIVWNSQRFRMDEVLRQAKQGPQVTIKLSELAQIENLQYEHLKVSHSQVWDPDDKDNFPVFYKFEGKYLCLLGHANLNRQQQDPKNQGVLKGRLVSGPMLKKARIVEGQVDFASTMKADPSFQVLNSNPNNRRGGWTDRDSGAIQNRARVRDERRTQQYGGAVKGNDRYV